MRPDIAFDWSRTPHDIGLAKVVCEYESKTTRWIQHEAMTAAAEKIATVVAGDADGVAEGCRTNPRLDRKARPEIEGASRTEINPRVRSVEADCVIDLGMQCR